MLWLVNVSLFFFFTSATAQDWDCSKAIIIDAQVFSDGSSPFPKNYPSLNTVCTFMFSVTNFNFTDVILTFLPFSSEDKVHFNNTVIDSVNNTLYEFCSNFEIALIPGNNSLGGVFEFTWSIHTLKNYTESTLNVIDGEFQTIPFPEMIGSNILTINSTSSFILLFPTTSNKCTQDVCPSFIFGTDETGRKYLLGSISFFYQQYYEVSTEPYVLTIVTDFGSIVPNYADTGYDVLILQYDYWKGFGLFVYLYEIVETNKTITGNANTDWEAIAIKVPFHLSISRLADGSKANCYSGTGSNALLLTSFAIGLGNSTEFEAPAGGNTLVLTQGSAEFKLLKPKDPQQLFLWTTTIVITPYYNKSDNSHKAKWNFVSQDGPMDIAFTFIDTDAPDFKITYKGDSTQLGHNDTLYMYKIESFTIEYINDSGRGGKLEFMTKYKQNWDCTQSIVINTVFSGVSPFNESYPQCTSCIFHFIVKEGTYIDLFLNFTTFSNDTVTIGSKIGANYSTQSAYNDLYELTSDFDLILSNTEHGTLGGLLSFFWNTRTLENYSQSTLTVQEGQFQTIPLTTMTETNVLTIVSSSPFVLVFPGVDSNVCFPQYCPTFFYKNDINGTYLGAIYNLYKTGLKIDQEPYKIAVVTDFTSILPIYSNSGYDILITQLDNVAQYENYFYISLPSQNTFIVQPIAKPVAMVVKPAISFSSIQASNYHIDWFPGVKGLNFTPTYSFNWNDCQSEIDECHISFELPDGGNTIVFRNGSVRFDIEFIFDPRLLDPDQLFIVVTPNFNIEEGSHALYMNFTAQHIDIEVTSIDTDGKFRFNYLEGSVIVGEDATLTMYYLDRFSIEYMNDTGRGGKLTFVTRRSELPTALTIATTPLILMSSSNIAFIFNLALYLFLIERLN